MKLSRRQFVRAMGGLFVPASGIVRASIPTGFYGEYWDPEVVNWADVRVPANSGSVSYATKRAANRFMITIKNAGLRSLIYRANLFCGNDFTHDSSMVLGAPGTPLIIDKGGGTDSAGSAASNFTYTETGSGGGLKRTADYVQTGLVASSDYPDANSNHQLFYVTAGNSDTSDILMGVAGGGTNWFLVVRSNYIDYWGMDNYDGAAPFSDGTTTGCYTGVRTASNASKCYRGGTQLTTHTAASVSRPTSTALVFGRGGFVDSFTTKTCGGYSIGLGMDATQVAAYADAWQAFESALGRQV